MTQQLYLAKDVYVCATEGHGVFLDLRRDKYSAVIFPSAQEQESASGPEASAPLSLAQNLAAHRDDLLGAGLLTSDPDTGRPIEGAFIERIDGHVFGADDQRAFGLTGVAAKGLKISLVEIWDFFMASWKASRDLKGRHIYRIVDKVRQRKANAGLSHPAIEKVRRLTAVYRRLRPWYPRNYLCLYDSLALVEFMAMRGVHPLWVFAVQAQPFGAHCWVQSEGLLLNEGSEYAGLFTPIMAV
jgi:hypothetical protein